MEVFAFGSGFILALFFFGVCVEMYCSKELQQRERVIDQQRKLINKLKKKLYQNSWWKRGKNPPWENP